MLDVLGGAFFGVQDRVSGLMQGSFGRLCGFETVGDDDPPRAVDRRVAVRPSGVAAGDVPPGAAEVGAHATVDVALVGAGELVGDRAVVDAAFLELGLPDVEDGEQGEVGAARRLVLASFLVLLGHLAGAVAEDLDRLFALADVASEVLPLAEAGDAGGVGPLGPDQQSVVEEGCGIALVA